MLTSSSTSVDGLISSSTSDSLSASENDGRLSRILRRLGFFNKPEISPETSTSQPDIVEHFMVPHLLPPASTQCSTPRPSRSGVLSRCEISGAGQTPLDVGLNSVISLKQRHRAVACSKFAATSAATFQRSAAVRPQGIHMRSRLACNTDEPSIVSFNFPGFVAVSTLSTLPDSSDGFSDTSVSSLSTGLSSLASHLLYDSERNSNPVDIPNYSGKSDSSASSLPSSDQVSSVILDKPIPSILVTSDPNDSCTAMADFALSSSPNYLSVNSVDINSLSSSAATSSPPLRPNSLSLMSSWNFPSSCRSTSCMLTTSLSTVVHSRVAVSVSVSTTSNNN